MAEPIASSTNTPTPPADMRTPMERAAAILDASAKKDAIIPPESQQVIARGLESVADAMGVKDPTKPVDVPVDATAEAAPPEEAKAPEEVVPPTEQTPEQKRQSEQFAAHHRREKKLVQREQSLSAKDRQLTDRETALNARAATLEQELNTRYAAPKQELDAISAEIASAKTNPGGLLKRIWGDDWYNTLTQYQLAGEQATPAMVQQLIDDKLAAQREELEQRLTTEREAREATENKRLEAEKARTQQNYDEAIEAHRQTIKSFVVANSDKYPLTAAWGREQTVAEVIEQHFDRTTEVDSNGNVLKPGRILSPAEAAELVEKALTADADKAVAIRTKAAKPTAPATKAPGTASPIAGGLNNGMNSSQAAAKAAWDKLPALERAHLIMVHGNPDAAMAAAR